MWGRAGIVALVLLEGCHPRLPLRIAGAEPPLLVESKPVQVLEASASSPPAWLYGGGARGGLALVGSGSGASLDEARVAAQRDLDQATSRYLSVNVAAESEAVEAERVDGDRTESSATFHAESHARVEALVSALTPDAEYWEKVAPSPERSDEAKWRVHLRARPKPEDLDRARLHRSLARARARGHHTAIVLASADRGEEGRWLERAIARHVAGLARWSIADPDLVHRARLDLAHASALPSDVVFDVALTRTERRIDAKLTLYDAEGRALATREVSASEEERLQLPRQISLLFVRELDARFPHAKDGAR